jgi:hypothetical protein
MNLAKAWVRALRQQAAPVIQRRPSLAFRSAYGRTRSRLLQHEVGEDGECTAVTEEVPRRRRERPFVVE